MVSRGKTIVLILRSIKSEKEIYICDHYDTPVRAIRHRSLCRSCQKPDSNPLMTLIHDIEAIPYNIVEEKAKYRESIYRERAVASERVRLAMGLSLRPENKAVHLTDGLAASNIDEKYYEPPLMQVIPSACAACPAKQIRRQQHVPRLCGAPMYAGLSKGRDFHERRQITHRPGANVSSAANARHACPYDAISHNVRPCEQACGVKAIGSDEQGRASILQDKCVSCGMCMVKLPVWCNF